MILDTLAAASKERAAELINKYGLNALRREAEALPKTNRGFAVALKQKGISFICEVKKASPSKGLIAKEFNSVQQAKEYEAAGAAAISCLTEPDYFLGSNEYLMQIAKNVGLPVLRKDFTVSPAQLYEAKIIGRDEKSDLAIIKIKAKNLPFLKFASSDDLQVGDVVFAIGNPFGVGESVTQGIISALNKSGIGINDYENFIQTDASINPGNSGGALVDSRGGLIGINTAILSRTGGNHGIGFAIPSSMVKKISKALIEDGEIERGYLGVSIQDISGDLKEVYKNQNGAVVISIEKDSPAQKGGLKVWDLITKVNGKAIKSAAELKNYIGTCSPKDKVTLTILRDKKEQTLTLSLTKVPDSNTNGEKAGGIDGLEVSTLTPDIKNRFGIPNNIQGVFITQVKPNSKAEEIGFSEGDIIVQIESFAILDIQSFNQAINRYKGQPKRMLINRGGRILSVVIK